MTLLPTFDLRPDPRDTAERAGLHYVGADEPGYTRVRCGRGFSYRTATGRILRGKRLLKRIRRLVIPPGWTDVWICRAARGHIQATGRDASGRKQYIYHPRFVQARERSKYRRTVAFGALVPKLRRVVARDLASSKTLTRRRVLAAIVRLAETSLVRIGYPRYARDNGSYGLTTIRKRHVINLPRRERSGPKADTTISLAFKGKSGREWEVTVTDPDVVDVINACYQVPGWKLFKFFDCDGEKHVVEPADINTYLRDATDHDITAKDIRTWAATCHAAAEIATADGVPDNGDVLEAVSDALGNTPRVCQVAYIHPEVMLGLEDAEAAQQLSEAFEGASPGPFLKRRERAVLEFFGTAEVAPQTAPEQR